MAERATEAPPRSGQEADSEKGGALVYERKPINVKYDPNLIETCLEKLLAMRTASPRTKVDLPLDDIYEPKISSPCFCLREIHTHLRPPGGL